MRAGRQPDVWPPEDAYPGRYDQKVREGIEDYYWMYPRRDEVIQHNIDCVRKVVTMCEVLGREVATPDRARDILGVRKT